MRHYLMHYSILIFYQVTRSIARCKIKHRAQQKALSPVKKGWNLDLKPVQWVRHLKPVEEIKKNAEELMENTNANGK